MAELATMKLKGEHWIIMDAIANSPNGVATTGQIQAAFGTRGMAEPLEELFDAGAIGNTYEIRSNGQPPKRKPHHFEFSPAGQQLYARRRTQPAADKAIAAAREAWEAEESLATEEQVEDEKPKRGRPPGAKNKPKEAPAGVE